MSITTQLSAKSIQMVRQLVKLRLLWFILAAFLLLSGCVRDDVGVSFKDANHGVITQRIRLSAQMTGMSQATAELWLNQLTEQTEQLGGKVQHPAEREWILSLPFVHVKDLLHKFEQSQQMAAQPAADSSASRSQPLSHLSIQTNNLIIGQRHRLSYDLDLRGLGVVPNLKNTATVLLDSNALPVVEFGLNTPWGARATADSLRPIVNRKGRELRWLLKPTVANHLEAVFWLPSSVGIGSLIILGLVIVGMFLKAWLTASRPSLP